jgi:hypothetical protein
MKRIALLVITVFLCSAPLAHGQAQWKLVERFLKDQVEVREKADHYLILYHESVGDSVMVSVEDIGSADIVGKKEVKRGGNPYYVWVATEGFWNNKALPRSEWGKYFRSRFLDLIRPPAPDE